MSHYNSRLLRLIKSQNLIPFQLRRTGTPRLCLAMVLVAQWLAEQEPDARKRRSGGTAQFAQILGHAKEAGEAKRQVDLAVTALWQARTVGESCHVY